MQTLTLSHSSRKAWQLCPRLFWLTFDQKLECGGCGQAAAWGTALHKGLAAWHRHGSLTLAKGALRGSWPADTDKPVMWGERRLIAYTEAFGKPDPDFAKIERCEAEFCYDVGQVSAPGYSPVLVRMAGTADLIARDHKKKLVLGDHKSTALSSDLWLAGERVSDQWPTYALGCEALFGELPERVVLNYISTRDKDGGGIARFEVPIDKVGLAEWRRGVLADAEGMLRHYAGGVWPQFRTSCTRQWGRRCDWYDHCAQPADRQAWYREHCAEIKAREPGPTERRQPLGLGTLKVKQPKRK